MANINKLVETNQITYTTTTDMGDVTIVLQKTNDGSLRYSIAVVNTGTRPTWSETVDTIEAGNTVVLI